MVASTSGDDEQAKLPPEKGAQVDLQGEKGVIHANEEGDLQDSDGWAASPWLLLCTKVYV